MKASTMKALKLKKEKEDAKKWKDIHGHELGEKNLC